MSIFTPNKQGSPPSVAEIEQQAKAQRERVVELEAQVAAEALNVVSGDGAAIERHRKLKSELHLAHENLHLLNQAHAGAIERDRAALEANRAKVREAQRRSCHLQLASLAKDADALQASIETTVKLYQQVLDRASKAHAATPIGIVVRDNELCSQGTLRKLVIGELYRVSGQRPNLGGSSLLVFPGGGSPDLNLDDQPEKIPALADQVREEVETFKRIIDGQTE